MLDLAWERTIPLLDVGIAEIRDIMNAFDPSITVADYSALNIGCKNSNFRVRTSKGAFLLRMTDIQGFNNEAAVYEMVKDKVCVPALLFQTTWNRSHCFVYRFIEGISLQRRIINDNRCDPSLLKQVAEAAAIIHNIPERETRNLARLDVPPYEVWYRAFMDQSTTKAKMGGELLERTRRLVSGKSVYISMIDNHRSLIHNDFRPANMLVDQQDRIWFVDWEGAWWGHSLADIGQFFRYRAFFRDAEYQMFAQTYNAVADNRLPEDWLDLSLFRDLVNLLQLLSVNQAAPQRDADLLRILESTLGHWGY